MRLGFRQRIALLVALAAATFVAVTVAHLVLGGRAERLVAGVETRYLPLLELDRELDARFAAIPAALEDAASGADEERLREADALRGRLAELVTAERAAIAGNGGDPEALLRDLDAYYGLARRVTTALMADAAGDALADDVEAMRRAQQALEDHLGAAAAPDRAAMAASFQEARAAQAAAVTIGAAVSVAAVVFMLLWSWWIVRGAVRALHAVSAGMGRLAEGEFGTPIEVATGDEFGDLAREANRTAERLRVYRELSAREDWLKGGASGLAAETVGELPPATLGRRVVSHLARYLDAPVAAVYTTDDAGTLHLLETYAAGERPEAQRRFGPGEGLVGQAARDDEVRVLADVPAGYLSVRSALGSAAVRHLVVVPCPHEGRAMAVIELGFLSKPSDEVLELVQRVRGPLGVAFQVAASRQHVQALLEETQRQAEELEIGQEELRQTNEELEQQAVALEAHRSAAVKKNEDLIEAQAQLEHKAAELAQASRYKSEFLASMSHELRTPLNSIMILSRVLADNEDGALDERLVEFARVIHKSGDELLTLINDVLDLAKVEAGRQDIVLEQVATAEVAAYVRRMFGPVAAQKQLALEVDLGDGVPAHLRTDRARLEQILKNLIANAIKFTERGHVTVALARRGDQVVVAVTDTGIGIASDQQARVFDAFVQAEGGTSRRFGGSGLGLTISRQLAVRLGGDLTVRSEVGAGSTFELSLPVAGPREADPPPRTAAPPAALADDRTTLGPGDQCLLVIEDDLRFAEGVLRLVREAGFKGLVAGEGGAGLELAARHRPSGIILDVGLPDMDGWSVMERLRADRATREIPVHLVTAGDDVARARRMGAVGLLTKPVAAEHLRRAILGFQPAGDEAPGPVLVVDGDEASRAALVQVLGGLAAAVAAVATAAEALERVRAGGIGCVLIAVGATDPAAGLALVDHLRADPGTAAVPVVVHAAVELTPAQVQALEGADQVVVVQAGERSPQRVLEETRLFLHRVRRGLPAQRQRMTEVVHGQEPALQGKTVLIVDDDMRNVYSLSSALRAKEMRVLAAENGQAALDQLAQHPETGVVLMDVMMPGMDGLEAIGHIRSQPRFARLPIIALTARTMAGERQRCLDAGADDYVAKPVDLPRLLDLLRVWLSG